MFSSFQPPSAGIDVGSGTSAVAGVKSGGDAGSGFISMPAVSRPSVEAPRPSPSSSSSSSSSPRPRPSGEGKPRPSGSGSKPTPEAPVAPETPAVEAAPVAQEATGGFKVSGQWNSRYNFRGLDVLDRVSTDPSSSGMAQWSASYTHVLRPQVDGLTLEFSHVEALDPQRPRGVLSQLPPNVRAFRGEGQGFNNDNAEFRIPPAERYVENQIYLNYTRRLPFDLEATAGLSYYAFSDGRWWQASAKGSPEIDDTLESQIRLKYYGLKFSSDPKASAWIIPSVSYAVDWVGFKGEFLDLGLETKAMSFNLGPVPLLLSLRGGAGYDFGYNAKGNDWNHLSGGGSLIIPLDQTKTFAGSGLEFKVSADYIHALDDNRADDGWFFGIGLGTSQAIVPGDSRMAALASKDPLSLAAAPDHKWQVSAGTGWRTWSAEFTNAPALPFNALSLFGHKTGSGDLGFASNGHAARYKDGTVYGSNTRNIPGTSQFSTHNGGQVQGSSANGDRHVIYNSDRYSYDQVDSSRGFSASSDQELIAPYLQVMRDISPASWAGRGRHLKLGFIYAYSTGEFDSGTQVTSLSQGFETADKYQFIYAVDEIFTDAVLPSSNSEVIIDANTYANNYGDSLRSSGPQGTHTGVRNNLSRVASFTKSSLSLSAHELALPIEFDMDLGTRWHVALSVAPTIGYIEGKLSTDIVYKKLPDTRGGSLTANNGKYGVFKFASVSRFDDEEGALQGSGTSTGAASPAASPASQPADQSQPQGTAQSGKGSRAVDPNLPGITVAQYWDDKTSQEFTWGVKTRATVRFDLDEQDRFFLEAWAGYHFMDKVTFSNRYSSVTLDPSNWELGVGLGCRF